MVGFFWVPGFVAQIVCGDSCCASSVIAGVHKQLDTDDLQDQKLGGLQSGLEATRITFALV